MSAIGKMVKLDKRPWITRMSDPIRTRDPKRHLWVHRDEIRLPPYVSRIVAIAESGYGKTTLLGNLARSALEAEKRVVVLDGKGIRQDIPMWIGLGREYESRVRVVPEQGWKLWTGRPVDAKLAEAMIPESSEPVFKESARGLLHALVADGAYWSTSGELLDRLARPRSYLTNPHAILAAKARLAGQAAHLGVHRSVSDALQLVAPYEDPVGFNFDTDFDLAVLSLPVSSDAGAQRMGVAVLAAFSAWVTESADTRPTMVIVDEAGSFLDSPAVPPAKDLLEKVRSSGHSIVLASQSFDSLGRQARQIIHSGADLIVGRTSDPDELLQAFGTVEHEEETASSGLGAGAGSYRVQHTFAIQPTEIRDLPPGVFIIKSGSTYACVRPYA